ncbi:MAG: hypothetical protein ACYTG0_00890 [Planctomycetota bacterium]|jgi:hypothetical protein
MNVWNKIFLGLILLASAAFVYLAARALKTHEYWRDQANDLEQKLAAAEDAQLIWTEGLDSPEVAAREQELQKLGGPLLQAFQQAKQELEALGPDGASGLRLASLALHKQLLTRGRVWRGCEPSSQPVTAQTGQITVKTLPGIDHQIKAQAVLWMFDEALVSRGPGGEFKGGRYLGQFKVTSIGGQDGRVLQLQPTAQMPGEARQALDAAAKQKGARWTLCEVMPVDSHEVYTSLSDDVLQKVLPEASVGDYLMDGKITTVGEVKKLGLKGKVLEVDEKGSLITEKMVVRNEDGIEEEIEVPVQREVTSGRGKFVRQLRDYEEIFRYLALQRSELINKIDTVNRHQDYIYREDEQTDEETGALADAKKQHRFRQQERDRLDAERKQFLAEKETVASLVQEVEGTLAAIQKAIDDTLQANRAMAAEIAKIQSEATRLIDERTRMAQLNSGQ